MIDLGLSHLWIAAGAAWVVAAVTLAFMLRGAGCDDCGGRARECGCFRR